MKITNVHIGYLIAGSIFFLLNLIVYHHWKAGWEMDNGVLEFLSGFTIVVDVFLVTVLTLSLIIGNIEFEFTVPNPFLPTVKALKAKREAAERINHSLK